MIYSREELLAIGSGQLSMIFLSWPMIFMDVWSITGMSSFNLWLSEGIRKQTIVINGVSKAYAMTGWRVGYAVGDPEIVLL